MRRSGHTNLGRGNVMKAVIMTLGVFGPLGCPFALADSSLPPQLGSEAGTVSVLTDAELSSVRGMAAPTGSRTNSKSTYYYTDYSYQYNPDTGYYDYVEGDTSKTTSKYNTSTKTKVVKTK
jgi:hypothetical protein